MQSHRATEKVPIRIQGVDFLYQLKELSAMTFEHSYLLIK